jgi:AcrR family transcriptional regulator
MAATTPRSATLDGRSARAARTRQAVVDALLALLHEGRTRPTAREIAARAGVSLRSVYVHFDDLDDLFTAAAAANFEQIRDLLVPVDADRPLDERIVDLVRRRARVYEAVAPVRRAAKLAEPTSGALHRIIARARRMEQGDTSRVFARELSGRGTQRLETAVQAASGATAWDVLRSELGLAVDEAITVMTETLRALFAAHRSPVTTRRGGS